VPRKELFEVFQSHGVSINDGKYSPSKEDESSDKNQDAISDLSSQVTDLHDTTHNIVDKNIEKNSANMYSIRRDTLIWVIILIILALVLSFVLGLNYAKLSSKAETGVVERNVESLEVLNNVIADKKPLTKPVVKQAVVKSVAVKKGKFALQIITYPSSAKWRKNAQSLVSLLHKKGLDANLKKNRNKLVVLVGNYNSKTDARLSSDKAVLSKIKIQKRYPFTRPLIVKR